MRWIPVAVLLCCRCAGYLAVLLCLCGRWVDIKELAAARKGGIIKRCPHCKKSGYFNTQNLKVVKGKVVKRKR